MKNILDVILDKNNQIGETDSIRMSIEGTDNIKKYWVDSEKYNNSESIFIEKERIDNLDVDDYNLRFSLKNELPKNDMLEKNKNLLKSKSENGNNVGLEKLFRLKNRYSIKTDDGLF